MKFKAILNQNSKMLELLSMINTLSKHDERIIIM